MPYRFVCSGRCGRPNDGEPGDARHRASAVGGVREEGRALQRVDARPRRTGDLGPAELRGLLEPLDAAVHAPRRQRGGRVEGPAVVQLGQGGQVPVEVPRGGAAVVPGRARLGERGGGDRGEQRRGQRGRGERRRREGRAAGHVGGSVRGGSGRRGPSPRGPHRPGEPAPSAFADLAAPTGAARTTGPPRTRRRAAVSPCRPRTGRSECPRSRPGGPRRARNSVVRVPSSHGGSRRFESRRAQFRSLTPAKPRDRDPSALRVPVTRCRQEAAGRTRAVGEEPPSPQRSRYRRTKVGRPAGLRRACPTAPAPAGRRATV